MATKKSTTSSMDVFDVTFIVFLINKLAGVQPMAEWSWWIVFSPIFAQILFILLVAAIAAIFGYGIMNDMDDKEIN